MDFILPFQLPPYPFKISYADKILLVGSCFSEEIGNKMSELKFNILQNPNGILYDPISISEALTSYIDNKPITDNDLFELNGLWHSWKHHSAFSGVKKDEVLSKINQSQSSAHRFLANANLLIITLGTSYQYQLKQNNQPVANCHKAPSSIFRKKLLAIEEITFSLLQVLHKLKIFNPHVKIIFTISPVKHVKDGIIENNRSKSRLIEAVHNHINEKNNCFYFPSYELVTDVLRDYRFYKSDLVHPNDIAIHFVFEKFCNSLLDEASKKALEQIKNIMSAVNHRPFLKESDAHKKFIQAQLLSIQKMEKEYPFVDFSIEKKYFND
ncbi:MAG: GSCFA domain-containing protein [Ginsengibacter sp.]